jgi:ribosomal protein L20
MSFSPVIIHSSGNRAGIKAIASGMMNQLLHKALFIFIFSLCISFIMAEQVSAQSGSGYYNPNDETFKLLGLKRAKEEYEKASKDLERVKTLFQEGHKSQKDLDDAQEFYSNREVNYQQQMLSVIFGSQYVTIRRAVKYSSDKGEKIMRITLDNTSSGSAELNKLANIDESLFKTLEPDVINNIYISIKNNDGAIIGQPYEQKIERLLPNQPKELDFVLLQDLDIVSVCLKYGNNITDLDSTEFLIFLGSKTDVKVDYFSYFSSHLSI